jgi:hypothetical protein
VGIGAREQLQPVAVLGIGGLLWAGQGFRLVLGAQKGGEEAEASAAFAQGGGKAPGGAGGVAVVVEVEVAFRDFGKAGEGEDGTGGQGGGAAALEMPPRVSAAVDALVYTQWAQSSSAWASTVFTASSCRSGG